MNRGALVLSILCAPSVVLAQSTAPAPAPAPAPPVVAPAVVADPSTAAQDPVSLPLRMTFLTPGTGGHFGSTGGCSQPSVDDAGTILPVQPHLQVQITLRLTLQAFSNLGCPGDPYAAFDTGVGGGFTYEAPIRPNLSLVGRAGAYGRSPGATSRTVGADLIWKTPERSTSVGVGATAPTGRGVKVLARVGGSF